MTKSEFLKLWLYGLVFKLALSGWLPFFSDEAYYWVWSKHPQLSYYDHPGMISWLFSLGHFLEPFGHAVRWPAVILVHLTLAVWFFLLRDAIAQKHLKLWALLAFFTPLTGLGSIIMTPDLPMVFFWSLSLLCLEKAVQSSKLHWYSLLGSSLGLGFCSKYHTVLFVPFVFIWIAHQKLWRQIQWKYVFATILIGLAFSSPVLIWNAKNDWISFKFQLNHGLGAKSFEPKWAWQYFWGQVFLLFPTIIYFAIRRPKLQKLTWLPVFAWGPLIFFFLTSFKGKVEANWTSAAYPSMIALAFFSQSQSLAKWMKATLTVWIVATLLVIVNVYHPLPFIEQKKLKTYEFLKYKPLYKVAESYQPFFASTFQMASKIWYETKQPTYKLHAASRRDFYDELPDGFPKEKTYFYAAQSWEKLPEWAQKKGHQVKNSFPMTDEYVLFEVVQP